MNVWFMGYFYLKKTILSGALETNESFSNVNIEYSSSYIRLILFIWKKYEKFDSKVQNWIF